MKVGELETGCAVVGDRVVGAIVGTVVAAWVVGVIIGAAVTGAVDGARVVGATVGTMVGAGLVGTFIGAAVTGCAVIGARVVGSKVGAREGAVVGAGVVGAVIGANVTGCAVVGGRVDGETVGGRIGAPDIIGAVTGVVIGAIVGAMEGNAKDGLIMMLSIGDAEGFSLRVTVFPDCRIPDSVKKHTLSRYSVLNAALPTSTFRLSPTQQSSPSLDWHRQANRLNLAWSTRASSSVGESVVSRLTKLKYSVWFSKLSEFKSASNSADRHTSFEITRLAASDLVNILLSSSTLPAATLASTRDEKHKNDNRSMDECSVIISVTLYPIILLVLVVALGSIVLLCYLPRGFCWLLGKFDTIIRL
jgi:hypothetical protein